MMHTDAGWARTPRFRNFLNRLAQNASWSSRGLLKLVGKAVLWAVVLFLIVSFAIWGIGDMFRG